MKKRWRPGRLVSWAAAVGALAFVSWVLPVRDRCWDPGAPASTRVSVSRDASGCVLHLQSGPVQLSSAECGRLHCEPGIVTTFQRARPGMLAALAALYALGTLSWAARWRALLSFAGVDLGVGEVWRMTIEAQAGGVLLPGGVGGDAFRVTGVLARPVPAGQERAPTSIIVASVLLDRAIGMALVAGIAAVLGWVSGGATNRLLELVLAAIPVSFLVALAALRRTWPGELPIRSPRLRGFIEPVLAYVRHPRAPRAIAVATELGIINASVQFSVVRGLVSALGATPTAEGWVYVGTAMAFIVGAVPALPGGWGTSDAAFIFFFGFAGLSSGIAVAVSLLYRLFWYLCAVVGAILHLAGARVTDRPLTNT